MRRVLLGAVLATALGSPAAATIVDQCRWPPPGGSSVLPACTEVMMNPLSADLDADGIPELVFISFAESDDVNMGLDGVLRIIRGSDCSEVATNADPGCVLCFGDAACHSIGEIGQEGVLCPGCGLAAGDLDGDGFLEIVAISEGDGGVLPDNRRLVIYDHLGQFLRCSELSGTAIGYVTQPAIADLDSDGTPEIAARTHVFEPDGSLRFAGPFVGTGPSTFADLDMDGDQEVVMGELVMAGDGSVFWHRTDLGSSFPAVADFDGDCRPEVVLVTPHLAKISLLAGETGATICEAVLPGGVSVCTTPRPGQGGSPVVADIDDDCVPEIGVAGCLQYAMYAYTSDPSTGTACLQLLWQQATQDVSSRITSSSVFDLEGDGHAEVLYNDEHAFRVYDGQTGVVLHEVPNTTHTLLEYPTVADVDADGQAEIVVGSNKYWFCCDSGLRVLHDDAVPWASTRAIHNQHAYHVTNVEDDGGIPLFEQPSWTRNNSYRSQPSPAVCDLDGCTFHPSCEVTVAPAACAGPRVTLHVSGTIEAEPGVGPLTFSWETDCPGAEISDPASLEIDVEIDGPPPCPTACSVTLVVTTGWGESRSCSALVSVTDAVPPSLSGVPADATFECATPPGPPLVTASDDCDPAPAVGYSEQRMNGPCPQTYTLVRTWTARDACGNTTSAQQLVTVQDTLPPVMDAAPAGAAIECGPVPAPATLNATDACDPTVPVTFAETREDGPCPQSYTLTRTWTAQDDCLHAVSRTQVIVVQDTTLPILNGVPAGASVNCSAVPPPPAVTASDSCDPTPRVDFAETRDDGPCAGSYALHRRWTATDDCGNSVSAEQVVTVTDTSAPVLLGAPGDVTVPCGAVPPAPTLVAVDDCGAAPPVGFSEVRDDGPCANSYTLRRTWTAQDDCGNAASAQQVVRVEDRTPPIVDASDDVVACFWPPNHWYVCIDAASFGSGVSDACPGEVSWRFGGCVSDQPDDANGVGDGSTTDDCVVSEDGQRLCARSERDGTVEGGRHYGVLVVAIDACGNESEPVIAGRLYVPHDQSPHEKSCLNPTKVGVKRLPW